MTLNRYIIERDIPEVGTLERQQLAEAAAKSNEVLAQLAPDIQWIESYVARTRRSAYISPRTRTPQARRNQRFSRDQGDRRFQDDRSDHGKGGLTERTRVVRG